MSVPQPQPVTWAIVPFIDCLDLTLQAVADLLAQTAPCRVLLVDQGSCQATSDEIRAFADHHHPQVLLWTFNPALPALAAVWNRALDFCWELGGTHAWVLNNDVRLDTRTLEALLRVLREDTPLFVSGVGVREADWPDPDAWSWATSRGGPDFSCFLVTQEGHRRYRFDEGCIPAYLEDLDAHRQYMLGGDGKRIFSVNLPFLHLQGGSRTINASEQARQRFERLASIGRAHYAAKWGGGPNAETFKTPFDRDPTPWQAQSKTFAAWPVTTPDLQRWYQEYRETVDENHPAAF